MQQSARKKGRGRVGLSWIGGGIENLQHDQILEREPGGGEVTNKERLMERLELVDQLPWKWTVQQIVDCRYRQNRRRALSSQFLTACLNKAAVCTCNHDRSCSFFHHQEH